MKRILVFVGLISLLGSCFEQGDCTDVSTNLIKINFYNFADKKPKTIALDSIKISGSSLIYYKAKSAPSVQLPLNPESESITYLLYFGNSYSTLDVQYRIRTFALAPDCPAIDLYNIIDATGVTINQIILKQKDISKNGTENLQLYF